MKEIKNGKNNFHEGMKQFNAFILEFKPLVIKYYKSLLNFDK